MDFDAIFDTVARKIARVLHVNEDCRLAISSNTENSFLEKLYLELVESIVDVIAVLEGSLLWYHYQDVKAIREQLDFSASSPDIRLNLSRVVETIDKAEVFDVVLCECELEDRPGISVE